MLMKWKLMITTLPYVLVVILTNLAIEYFFDFYGLIEFADIGLILTGGIFIMGFMLAGTMSDYKESEKMPAEIACILESLEETIINSSKEKIKPHTKDLLKTLNQTSNKLYEWFYKRISNEEMFESLNNLSKIAQKLDESDLPPYAVRFLNELNNLRRIMTRVHVISKTSFLQTGYALLEALIFSIVVLLFVSKFKSLFAEYLVISAVSLIYFYLYRLIKDIDDPFEYTTEAEKGASEVELFPLQDYLQRAKSRIQD